MDYLISVPLANFEKKLKLQAMCSENVTVPSSGVTRNEVFTMDTRRLGHRTPGHGRTEIKVRRIALHVH